MTRWRQTRVPMKAPAVHPLATVSTRSLPADVEQADAAKLPVHRLCHVTAPASDVAQVAIGKVFDGFPGQGGGDASLAQPIAC